DLLVALTYAMIGVLLGPLVGRLGGLYLVLLLAFIDVGYGQTVMFSPVPPAWGAFLPARGASQLMINGAFTTHFGQIGYLLLGLAWLAVLSVAAVFAFGRQAGVKLPRPTTPGPLLEVKS
ncbi:MAG: ABC transporter permease, partial [Acidimicrobiales bacterium]|nr:ABC transporter permease [Acidimicrobiales bacterium]